MSWDLGSLLSDIGTGLWDFVSSPGGGALLSGAAQGIGAIVASNANRDAANDAGAAAVQGAQIQADASARSAEIYAQLAREGRQAAREGADRGIGAIRAGTERSVDVLAPLLNRSAITLPTYRGLTAAEEIANEDLMRRGKATLAASGLRGAGRAGVAALMDTDRRFRADAAARRDSQRLAAEQEAARVRDGAASGLASIYGNEGRSIAATETGVGNLYAGSLQDEGRTLAAATQSAGAAQAGGVQTAAGYDANAGLANASLVGQAIGGIGSIVTNAARDDRLERIVQRLV